MNARNLSSPEQLAEWYLEDPVDPEPEHTLAAIKHRQRLLSYWKIKPGDNILEIGCGQGDFTVVLADAVGPHGHVVAVDPGPLDYGTPSLGSAQKHMSASPIGPRITFVQDDPSHYLRQSSDTFTHVVFCHCIWYFATPALLAPLLTDALLRSPSVLITEYSMVTSQLAAMPHILAATARSVLETYLSESSKANVRNILTPKQIRDIAEMVGWKIGEEHFVVPFEEQRDGSRAAASIIGGKRFQASLETLGNDAKKSTLRALQDAVIMSVDRLEGGVEKVRDMDVWVTSFSKS